MRRRKIKNSLRLLRLCVFALKLIFKIQSNVHRTRRVGERADGNKIHARPGNRMDGFQIYTAAGFGLHAAIDNFYSLPQLFQIHVVQQYEIRAGIHSLFDLFQSVGLDLDFQHRKFFPRAPNRGGDGIRRFIPQCGEVVVLDENHVEQTDAMILPTAASDGVFLKSPPAGRGFSGVKNLSGRPADRFNKLRGCRRNSRKPLEKIQRDALGAQDGAGRTGNFQQDFSCDNSLSVTRKPFNFDFRRKFAESGFGEIQAGNDERFARPHDGFGRRVRWNSCQRRGVAAADILGKCGADGSADFCGGQFHAVKMKVKGKWGKEK